LLPVSVRLLGADNNAGEDDNCRRSERGRKQLTSKHEDRFAPRRAFMSHPTGHIELTRKWRVYTAVLLSG
jgi:hypothetical protein